MLVQANKHPNHGLCEACAVLDARGIPYICCRCHGDQNTWGSVYLSRDEQPDGDRCISQSMLSRPPLSDAHFPIGIKAPDQLLKHVVTTDALPESNNEEDIETDWFKEYLAYENHPGVTEYEHETIKIFMTKDGVMYAGTAAHHGMDISEYVITDEMDASFITTAALRKSGCHPMHAPDVSSATDANRITKIQKKLQKHLRLYNWMYGAESPNS